MTVAIYIGSESLDRNRPRMFNHYHENFPGAVRIIEDIWSAYNTRQEPCVVVVNPLARFRVYRGAEPSGNPAFSADIVVMTDTGIGLVETKHNAGNITSERDGNWYAVDAQGRKSNVLSGAEDKDRQGVSRALNPHEQVQRYARFLKEQLVDSAGVHAWLPGPANTWQRMKFQTCACFTNRQASIDRVQREYQPVTERWEQFEIIKAEQIVPWVRSLSLGRTLPEYPHVPYILQGEEHLRRIAEGLLQATEWSEAYEWMPTEDPYAGLVLLKDGQKQQQYALRRREETIGRLADISIPQAYEIVGNLHASLYRDLDKVVIRNLHRHGTYVNQHEVGGEGYRLKDGDRITLGGPEPTDDVCLLVYKDEAPVPINTKTTSIMGKP